MEAQIKNNIFNLVFYAACTLLMTTAPLAHAAKVKHPAPDSGEVASGGWNVVTVDVNLGIYTGVWQGPLSSLTFHPQGGPAIAYYSWKNLKYARLTTSERQVEVVDDNTGKYSFLHAIALGFDDKDQPAIAYRSLKAVKRAHSDGVEWHPKILTGPSECGGVPSFLAVDPQGETGMIFKDGTCSELLFVHLKGQKTEPGSVIEKKKYFKSISFAFDETGTPGVAYHDRTGSLLKYSRFDGSEWKPQTVVEKRPFIQNISLAFDHQEKPGMCYKDGRRGIMCARLKGTKWVIQPVVREGRPASLEFDTNDNPVICYWINIEDDGEEIRIAHFDGKKWNFEKVAGEKDIAFVNLAIDSKGNSVVSYYDEDADELKLAAKGIKYPDYEPPPPLIAGKVTDATTGKQIKGATVYLTWQQKTTTDTNGHYEYTKEIDTDLKKISVTKKGYHERELAVKDLPLSFLKKPLEINIALHPKKYEHVTINVDDKPYQVTFIEQDTEKPKQSIVKTLIYTHQQKGNKSEDKEIKPSSLGERQRDRLLLKAHEWFSIYGSPSTTSLNNNQSVVLNLGEGDLSYYKINVPTDAINLKASLTNVTGNPEIYLKCASTPTLNDSNRIQSDPHAGNWYIMVRSVSTSSATLTVSYLILLKQVTTTFKVPQDAWGDFNSAYCVQGGILATILCWSPFTGAGCCYAIATLELRYYDLRRSLRGILPRLRTLYNDVPDFVKKYLGGISQNLTTVENKINTTIAKLTHDLIGVDTVRKTMMTQIDKGDPGLVCVLGIARLHALVVYGYKEYNSEVRFMVADNNYPDDLRTLIYEKNSQSWSYDGWATGFFKIGFISLKQLLVTP